MLSVRPHLGRQADVRSKRAFQQVIQAIRAGALDPSRNMASDIAALNGWTGFTADQYKNLLKFDTILADEKTGELEKAERLQESAGHHF
jgi:hypothetical protein